MKKFKIDYDHFDDLINGIIVNDLVESYRINCKMIKDDKAFIKANRDAKNIDLHLENLKSEKAARKALKRVIIYYTTTSQRKQLGLDF